ncbi:hypothetical protein GGF46_004455 [Coemansia sp. RSA 552]|nr:hypothetical protein GGF46_004455 [Coemansia sp. RSA 552]
MAGLLRKLSTRVKTVAAVRRRKPSGFQNQLPQGIFEHIVKYLKSTRTNRHLHQLLFVCQAWRAGAMRVVCRQYKLAIGPDSPSINAAVFGWPQYAQPPGIEACPLVNELELHVESWWVYSGKALAALHASQYSDFVFKAAHTLLFNVQTSNRARVGSPDNAEQNISMFVRSIRLMLPAIKTVVVSTKHAAVVDGIDGGYALDNLLLRRLCAGMDQVKIAASNHGVSKGMLLPMPVLNITELQYGGGGNDELAFELVRCNANTLRVLEFNVGSKPVFPGRRMDNTATSKLVFPQLTELVLGARLVACPEKKQDTTYTPFPALKSLKLLTTYTLSTCPWIFQNSSQTLKRLWLVVSADDATAINKLQVFGPDNFAHLQKVHVRSKRSSHHKTRPRATRAVVKLALGAGANATSLTISGFAMGIHFLEGCLNQQDPVQNLQLLDLDKTCLDLADMAEILRIAPTLQYLQCAAVMLGNELEDVPFLALVSEMAATCYPLSNSRFTISAGGGLEYVNSKSAAKCAILLATLGPGLAHIAVTEDNVDRFNWAAYNLARNDARLEEKIEHLNMPLFKIGGSAATARYTEYNFTLPYLGPTPRELVTELTLRLSWNNVFSGQALAMLDKLATETAAKLVFPRCQHVQVVFATPYTDRVASNTKVSANIVAFTQRVKEMAPAASSVKATMCPFAYGNHTREYMQCNQVLNGLSAQVQMAQYHGWDKPHGRGLQVHPKTGLTHLHYDWSMFGEESYQLLYAHADTLASVQLRSSGVINYNRLVQKSDRSAVIYPQLRTLRIEIDGADLNAIQWRTPHTVTFFPALREFALNNIYPFEDDTVFRGNRDILESISITIDWSSFESLRSHGMLGKGACPQLQCLAISQEKDAHLFDSMMLPPTMIGYWLQAAPKLTALSILVNDMEIKEGLLASLPMSLCSGSLQVLVVPYVRLSLPEMATLLVQLPLLTDLHCKPGGLGKDLDDAEPLNLVKTLLADFVKPLNKQFKFWRVVPESSCMPDVLAKMAMLLAVVCPQFTYAAVTPTKRAHYEDCLFQAMDNKPFSEYVDQIRPLFYKQDPE